jgi:NTE family protein
VVFEPNADDRELFYTNIFSFAARRRISQLAYRNTLADLRKRRDELDRCWRATASACART